MDTCKIGKSTLNSTVGSMEFSPCFLEQDGPNLAILRRAEGDVVGAFVDGHVVVHYDGPFDSVDVEVD
jgi:hypothetical protein